MKKGLIIFVVILSACNVTTDKTLEELHANRDSLQQVQYTIEKELNRIDMQIASLDSTVNPEDLQIIKKITSQKNRIAATQLKIRKLENQLTPDKKENLTPVEVKKIEGEKFNHYIIVYGKVEADNYALISPEMGGLIKTIHVNEGQHVSKGQLLVSLNTDAVEKQIEGVKSSLELAKTTFEKQDTLWKQGIGSEIQYLNAKTQKESLEAQLESLQAQERMAQIRAPFNGIVNKIYLKKGELASPGFSVVEFVNLSEITVRADVSESYLDKVVHGQIVDVTFAPLPDLNIQTPIRRVSKVIDNASRTFEIEVHIDNRNEKIRPNMVSTIHINDFSADSAYVVPSLAIRKDITGNYVYLVEEKEGKQVVKKKYIETSLSYEDKSMVEKGLKKGDRVVVEGYHLVSAGVPVKVIK
ncbi:MAG: efflux RND transporter periplasmic adaptor subunit [Bacteroidales bacterium]|jgi:RND family efflux transporter MFP subunit